MPSAIHGMVTKLSPLKESTRPRKKYFDGTFSDDSDTKRFVSFNTKLFQSMKEAKDCGASIALNKCSVKWSALNTQELEIVVSKSEVMQSPKKFKCDSTEIEPKTVYLSDIDKLAISSVISVQAKVIHLDPAVKIDSQKKPHTKQDCDK